MARTIPREVKKEDIGWLAGIIDGEGSITFQKPKKPQKTGLKKIVYGIHIVNSNEQLVRKCLRIINAFDDGRGKLLEVKPKQYRVVMFKMNKGCHQITVRRYGTIKNLLKAITPHLTEKKIKAEKLLNFVSNRKLHTRLGEEAAEKFLNFTPVETKRITPQWDETIVRACK